MKKNKVLIVRFSSFGDIVQCSAVVDLIAQKYPDADIHWVTRSEFSGLVGLNRKVGKVWPLQKQLGLKGLFKLAADLRHEHYDFVYDAHNNLRSKILSLLLRPGLSGKWLTRPKDRFKRLLLFTFRINTFPWPFKGIASYVSPLEVLGIKAADTTALVHWNFPEVTDSEKQKYFVRAPQSILLVPSAAWEMKRWPLNHWKKLIEALPHEQFMVLGGKEDLFCEELERVAPDRVLNLAGKLSLIESCALIKEGKLTISADTGLLHVADVLGKKAIALIGPTAFGFTTSSAIKTMEVNLPCRPCTKDGRGKCSQDVYQKCMVDITPSAVAISAQQLLHE